MKFIDIIVIITAILVVLFVCLNKPIDDGTSSFSGEKSTLFSQGTKERGFEFYLSVATFIAIAALIVTILIANGIDRLF